jgi:hypothetical protein
VDEAYVNVVAEQLRHSGLTHEVFDPDEVAQDLLERTEMNQTLDELIDSSGRAPAPTSFDPGWSP